MDYANAIKHLRAAEQELRKQISSDTGGADYDALYDCLKFSQQVSILIHTLEGADEATTAQGVDSNSPQKKSRSSVKKDKSAQVKHSDDKLPAYFVFHNKLWKIANSSKDDGSLYHKSVSIDDVDIVLDAISKAFKAQPVVTISAIEELLGTKLPSYKTQVTTMALLEAGILKSAGRGKYSLANNSPVSRRGLLNALERVEARVDLLEKAGVSL